MTSRALPCTDVEALSSCPAARSTLEGALPGALLSLRRQKKSRTMTRRPGVVGPRVAGLLTSVRCAPCSALPPGTWAAVLLETLSCAGLSFCLWMVGSVGQGSFLRERGSAERGAHPRCSHIPWGLRDARARRFPDSLFIGEFQPDAWE